ncbi:MAG: glycosyl transferase [Rhodospirillales bacterium]|nr:glycosyl transferase [Rhodospirillales bacterium]
MTLPDIILLLAAIPAAMATVNLVLLQAPHGAVPAGAKLSILIPARDEEHNIRACVESALMQSGVELEVIVMDDDSRDATPAIVREIAARDPRLRLEQAPPLPKDWAGKVHACARLAERATGTHLLFLDADVRLEPGAAAAMLGHAARTRCAMVSGVPRQVIGTLGEALTVPIINLLLAGYLPAMGRAFTRLPAMAAGCGQLQLVDRAAYTRIGGHESLKSSLHDGLKLARALRRAGERTELVQGANFAHCRMYEGFSASWNGFLKNAGEGMATPIGLPIWTTLLTGGFVAPFLLLPESALAAALALGLRAAITRHAREPWWTIPLLPLAILVALAIQWTALARAVRGTRTDWKGRAYGSV